MTAHNTRKALGMSLVALVLCFAMLIGSTFAWFTDSASSTGNIIKTGTLDVKMEWKDATTAGAQQTYLDASEGAMFFNDLWEPGYVEAKNVKISNIGTLALQYNLNIAANGVVTDLANVIEVYFADGEYTLADRSLSELTLVGTLADILNGMPENMYGDLGAGASNTVTIALKMKEDAGNEYQMKEIGTTFSIILIATQDNVESDSFDADYDDIEIPEYVIKEIDGNKYNYYNNGQVVLTSVPYGNVSGSFTVPSYVNVIGQGDSYNEGDPVFSKYADIQTIVVSEGVTEIKARAMNIKALKELILPSTLEVIGNTAIAQTIIEEIYIPASVKEIQHAAFSSSSKLTTVTIAGNATLDNYMFRGCSSLESIYLLGDDVNFVNTSGNAKFFACRTENGRSFNADGTPGLTIYVKNATVAERVYAAMKDCTGYVVKVLGNEADGSDAGEIKFVNNATDFNNAVVNGVENIVLNTSVTVANPTLVGSLDGNGNTITANNLPYNSYDCAINTKGGKISNVTIIGKASSGGTRAIGSGSTGTYVLSEDLYIDNVTLKSNFYGINGSGVAGTSVYVTNSTVYGWHSFSGIDLFSFDNCVLGMGTGDDECYDGYIRVYGDTSFKNCTFEGVFDMGAYVGTSGTITIENCYYDGDKVTAENFVEYFYYGAGDERDFGYLMNNYTIIVDGVVVLNAGY